MSKKPTPQEIARGIWMLHDKYQRWTALGEVHHLLPDRLFYKEFVGVWTNSESNDRHLPLIDRLIEERGVTGEKVMPCLEAKERKTWAKLPERVRVYRGTTMEEPYGDYSWTVNLEKATWFAMRCFDGTPAVASGWADKKDIWFVYNGRSEEEVAVHHDRVQERSLEAIAPWQANAGAKLYNLVQSGGLDALSPDLLRMRVEHAMMMRTFEEVKQAFYGMVEECERLGFRAHPAALRGILDDLDWDEIREVSGPKMEQFRTMIANEPGFTAAK